VTAFVDQRRNEEPMPPEGGWTMRRVLLVVIGVPLVVIVLFYAYLLWAMSTCGCEPVRTFPPSPVVGVVISVDTPSLGKVNGFDLRLADGSTLTLKVGVLENATQFSPSHLLAHEATSVPIRAFYRLENGAPVVYRLEDASPAAT
jgi:hypothetical protein